MVARTLLARRIRASVRFGSVSNRLLSQTFI